MVNRLLKLSKNHSFFIFGGRGTGKSTLLKSVFSDKNAIFFDLLDPDLEQEFSQYPSRLKEKLKKIKSDNPKIKWVVIDEVQKIPKLLEVVHSIIEEKHFHFALTGSSSRKLKRGQANLLAGRAFVFYLFPFSFRELSNRFNLIDYLSWGGLPKIFEYEEDADKKRFLVAYTQTYLKEEIVAEQLVRNLVPFRAFLEVAAQSNGKIISYSKIGRDINVEVPTVQNYFEILQDTLIGFLLNPHHESYRKRQRHNPKFYYFDPGVQRALSKRLDIPLKESTTEYGDLFESFIIQEIYRLIQYQEKQWELSYLRTKDDFEIDLIIELPGRKKIFIEIKSTDHIDVMDFSKLQLFVKNLKNVETYVFSQDKNEFIKDHIQFLHWENGIKKIGL